MFTLTVMIDRSPSEVAESVRGLGFQVKKEGLELNVDGHVFRIQPFKYQDHRVRNYGYRICFDMSIESGAYFFETTFGHLQPHVQAIEYDLDVEDCSQMNWNKELIAKGYRQVDARGIYSSGSVGIVVLDECVNMQVRSVRRKSLNLNKSLHEIMSVRDEIHPPVNHHDLFSFVEEEDMAI
ncbi:hypothetical protein [Desertibacillus haloalkaliphilus]|uniref:hypothetical protein n=1 Tax=Desertibacillus haloalkaliphilus TaxID=1328930 RepID=UPI001C251B67|nr:hypothetical protein [Desertibacillus haloalkaliphilus]MBU8908187.1 hypothetical protein [Desertibacillus haloalkaliphilus]